MAWPTVSELKTVLDVDSTDFDTQFTRWLAAAVEQVKLDVGDWDEAVDSPTSSLESAALLLAVRMAKAPAEAPAVVATEGRQDPAYRRFLKGHRRRFAIA